MAFCKLCGPSETFSDNRVVVPTLNTGEVDCISAGHHGVDSWVLVWSQIDECIEEGSDKSVMWTEAHTTLEEKAKMSLEDRQVAWANEKADELPKTGALKDGAEVAERTAKHALDTRKKVYAAIRYAATFHDEIEELVDVEEISEENKKTQVAFWL